MRKQKKTIRRLKIVYDWNRQTIEGDRRLEDALDKLLKKFGWEWYAHEYDLETKKAISLYERR